MLFAYCLTAALAFSLAALFYQYRQRQQTFQRLVQQYETAIRDNQRFLKTLTDIIPGMVGYWTHELSCGFANNEYRAWFGKSPEEMLGMRLQDVIGAEHFAEIEPYIRTALGGERQQLELTLTRPDGRVGHTWVHFIPDSYGDQTLGFYMLVSDVTELKQTQFQLENLNEVLQQRTQEAEAANIAKSRFLANMSHEIRTPMNAVQGLLHLLQRSGLSARQQDYVTKIQGASRSLLAVLNDILDFSKVEAGKLELEHSTFRLDDVLNNLAVILTSGETDKAVVVQFSVDADLPRTVQGDALRLQQVLLNLAGNAVKFTDRGTVTVAARVVSRTPERAEIEFSVRDTGIGIAPDKLESIFDDFVQAESSTTRRFGGTGLGLTISQRLVQLMGGELTVESEPDRGSTFRFSITFDVSATDTASDITFGRPADISVTEDAASSSGRLQGLRLLVVEDNRINQQVAQEVLSLAGADVDLAATGREGIECVARAESPYDAVLMDIQMPDMDGYAATRHIRKVLKKRELPIIAMTANALPTDRENCLAAGMNEHIIKPIDVEQLMDVLQTLCGGRTATVRTGQAAPLGNSAEPPGFDLGQALLRLGGNRTLYAQLARDFVSAQKTTIADLKKQLELGENGQAAHTLHALKGVAANLGATALSRAAKELESTLATIPDPARIELQLRHLETALRDACGMLKNRADEFDPDAGLSSEETPAVTVTDQQELISTLSVLENLLYTGNMRAVEEFRTIRQLTGTELLEQLTELDQAMSRLDFPAAAATCRAMREVLNDDIR